MRVSYLGRVLAFRYHMHLKCRKYLFSLLFETVNSQGFVSTVLAVIDHYGLDEITQKFLRLAKPSYPNFIKKLRQ